MSHKKSIAHFQGREQQLLFKIKNSLVDQLQPLIIYVIGCQITTSSKRNCFLRPQRTDTWQFSCDLFLVLPEGKQLPEHIVADIKCLSPDLAEVRVLHATLDLMQQQIKEQSLFFNWLRRNGIVIYEKDNELQQLPPRLPKHIAYEQQATQYYLANPNYEHHIETKLVPLPPKPAPPPLETVIPLQLAIKDGTLVVLPEAKK